jgi:hypothetical protein
MISSSLKAWIKVLRIGWIVVNYLLNFNFPFTIVRRPKSLSKPFHNRLNERLIRMIRKKQLKFVDIKWSIYTD